MRVMRDHPDDGTLLALLDGETQPDAQLIERHVAFCERCRARRDAMVRDADLVSRSVSLIAPRAPTIAELRARRPRPTPSEHRSARRFLPLIAATVLFAAAALATASPLRHWLSSRANHSTATPASPRVSTPAPQSSRQSTLRFVPSGDVFTVRIDSASPGGTLDVRLSTDDRAGLQAVDSASAPDSMAVLPAELRLHNHTRARLAYTLALPRSVTRVRVIVDNRVIVDAVPPAMVLLERK